MLSSTSAAGAWISRVETSRNQALELQLIGDHRAGGLEFVLAGPQFVDQLTRAQEVTAHFVAHDTHHAEKGQADEVGRMQNLQVHQRAVAGGGQDEGQQTAADEEGLTALFLPALPPQAQGGVADKREHEQRTKLVDVDPWVACRLGCNTHRLAEQPDLAERQDFAGNDVLPRGEVQDQGQSLQADGGPGEPRAARAEAGPDETHQGRHQDGDGHIGDPDHRAELGRGVGAHHQQFPRRRAGHPQRGQGKAQIGPRRAVLEPHQRMHSRQGQAGRRGHRPENRDPAHAAASNPGRNVRCAVTPRLVPESAPPRKTTKDDRPRRTQGRLR